MNKIANRHSITIKQSLRLLYRNQFITKIITVLLSAFSFMLFAMGAMAYTYNEVDYIARGYYHYHQTITADIYEGVKTVEDINFLKELTGSRFIYDSSDIVRQTAAHRYWYCFANCDTDWTDYSSVTPKLIESPLWDIFGQRMRATGSNYLYGSQADYQAFGFELLEGRYPTGKYEVAISEIHFQAFRQYGYCDMSNCGLFIWNQEQADYDFDFATYRAVKFKRPTVIPIHEYSDVIGKAFGAGDLNTDSHAYEYTIVGVVNTNYDATVSDGTSSKGRDIEGRLLFSDIWLKGAQTVYNYEWNTNQAYFSPIKEYSSMKKVVKLALKCKEEAENFIMDFQPSKIHMLYHTDALNNENITLLLGCGLGTFFGIFAALLCGHLVSRSIEEKQKQVGIMRSMGAGEKTVFKLFLIEILITATAIFLLALAGSLGIYYGWLQAWSIIEDFKVSILVYNGWTVCILAGLSYAVPLLSAIVPIKKFFKKPIINNIKGTTFKKQKKNGFC